MTMFKRTERGGISRAQHAPHHHNRGWIWLAMAALLTTTSVICMLVRQPLSYTESLSTTGEAILLLSSSNTSLTTTTTIHTIPNSKKGNSDNNENIIINNDNDNMLQCLHRVLHEELPLGKGKFQKKRNPIGLTAVYAHHFDAHNGKWNAEDRLLPMEKLSQQHHHQQYSSCSIWEVGAHKEGKDTARFLKLYPHCHFHAFEPIPGFYATLKKTYASEPRVTTHNYGLGLKKSTFGVDPSALKGQATFIGDSAGGGSITATIQSFDYAIQDANNNTNDDMKNQNNNINNNNHNIPPTLMHMNCEGCEWEVVPQLASSGWLAKIPIVQIGWHNYGSIGMGGRVWSYCELQVLLNQTHDRAFGMGFGWDRWVLRHKETTANTPS